MFKALALGAECCWVGRPVFWGLAVGFFFIRALLRTQLTKGQYNGQAGVELMLETYRQEFKRCMQLCGCNSVNDITKACLGVVRRDGPLARL